MSKVIVVHSQPRMWLEDSVIQPYVSRFGAHLRRGRYAPSICRRVQLWHEHGANIGNAMAALSTYVGHAKVSDTYWYLTGVPDLMAIAGARFEHFAAITGEGHHG